MNNILRALLIFCVGGFVSSPHSHVWRCRDCRVLKNTNLISHRGFRCRDTKLFLQNSPGGTYAVRKANLDINRFRNLPKDSPDINHLRRSLESNLYGTNDYDDYSSRAAVLRSPLLHAATTQTQETTKTPLKIYQPKEDPKLFYQSAAYLKESNGKNRKNVNYEVSHIYPGKEVIRPDDHIVPSSYLYRRNDMKRLLRQGPELCIKCPSDRTLITKVGSDRVRLMHPHLSTCTGKRVPKGVRLVHMYGPKFGSLLKEGTHVTIGRIMYRNETIHHCKLLIHVIVQSCPTPKYLRSQCNDQDGHCKFSCRDRDLELYGMGQLKCDQENMKWNGSLPICRVRKWCYPLSPPERGRITCKGDGADQISGMIEGSRCRLRCPVGWRVYPRSVAICRHGNWTNNLQCQPKLRNIDSVP